MELNLELPINSTSFGQISVCILRELKGRGINPNLFCIGNVDLSTQPEDHEFAGWINHCINKGPRSYKRTTPCVKLWHLNGSHNRISDKTILISFVETDSPTETELNIVRNNNKVLFTCNYTTNIFKDFGADNVYTIPLGFDRWNFKVANRPGIDDRTVWFLGGKFELMRKRTGKVLNAWARKFGNDRNHMLHAAVYNPFLNQQDNQTLINQALENKKYWNIQFFGYLKTNAEYNALLNVSNIVLAMGTECFGLPEFQSVALGKHALVLNAAGYKEWATNENSVLINPSSKIPVYDNIFFRKGLDYNQGSVFDWDIENFFEATNKVIERVKNDPVNHEGLKLQEKFSYKNTVDAILKHLE